MAFLRLDTIQEAEQLLGKKQVRKARVTKQAARLPVTNPEDDLWGMIVKHWPGEAVREFSFSARHRYRFDVAFVEARLAIECDGWQYHGKHKADFERDRKKDRLATMEGWRLLRFTAREIMQESAMVLAVIGKVKRGVAY